MFETEGEAKRFLTETRYSERKASTGATRVPRLAGMYDASVATMTSTTAVAANVQGSRGSVS